MRKAGLLTSMFAVLAACTPRFDPSYQLQPSTWKCQMTFEGMVYPCDLYFNDVKDGNVEGQLTWVAGSIITEIKGTYEGNRVDFRDTKFLFGTEPPGNGGQGLNEQKIVFIKGKTMVGTDKDGRAKFKATRVK